MARVALNKMALKQERDQLKLYQQYLPSLDLKRQQLMFELKQARDARQKTESEIERFKDGAAEWLGLLANREIEVSNLVQVESVKLGEQNLLGVTLPTMGDVEFKIAEYSMMAKPHWVDALVDALQSMARLHLQAQVETRRIVLLKEALRTITQRVNLFDKVLIPSARENIRHIQIALSDSDRAGVIRSKLAKGKRQKRVL